MQNKHIFFISQGPLTQMGKLEFNYFGFTNCPFLKGGSLKIDKRKVKFKQPFSQIPSIHTSFSWLNIDESKNLKIKSYPIDVTVEGFTLVLETCGVFTVEVSWIAALTD